METVMIGGGSLAGMACAIRLKQFGYHPLVLDKCVFPRVKLCGEFLGPDAFEPLRRLGVWEAVREKAWGPVERVRFFSRRGESLDISLAWMSRENPYALAIPRVELDALLVDAGRRLGVQVLEGLEVQTLTRSSGGGAVSADTQDADGKLVSRTFEAAWVVDATGRNGRLRLPDMPPRPVQDRRRVGFQYHARLAEERSEKDLAMFLFPGGYGGIQPNGPARVNVCMLVSAAAVKQVRGDLDALVAETIGRNPAAARMLAGSHREGPYTATADLNLDPPAREAPLLRVGDARVTVDPFTGSGMAHALETGLMAAECLHEGIRNGWDYGEICGRYHRAYAGRFHRRLQWLRRFRPVLESPRMQDWLWPLMPPLLPALTRTFR